MKFVLDRSVQRFGQVVIGGSPLKLFRLTTGGAAVVEQLADGDDVDSSALTDRFLDAGAIHPQFRASDARFTTADVTIVMPTLGEPARVAPGAIVVDDGSRPPVAGATIRLAVNRGPAAARNAGLALVTTPLVAFVDADVTSPPDWLDALLPHFNDARVALVAPRVTSAPASGSLGRYEQGGSPLDLGVEPARVAAGTRVSYVPSAAIVCRVDAVRELGGFDESLRAGEDVDLVWRLIDAGWRCRYEPASAVQHAARSTWTEWARQRITYGSSAAPLAKRHPGALAPLRMSGWSVAAWIIGMRGHHWIGTAIGLGSAAALTRKLPDVPPRAAFRLAALGNARAGEQLANAVRRAWWPIVLLAAWKSRTARRTLVAAALASRNPIRLGDDVAYSIGVWKGMIAERSATAIVPSISSWPGRSAPTPPADAR
ncbi:MAG TPA: mycofactocin biosynthesis glycosyltransferase MftF [Ilumatobacter sp.]|nr:mycofactocin biosynthesis glycosyltransferase MftF [Ilumatobacter sp.]